MAPFEKVAPPATGRPRGPQITITQRGALNLTAEATELLGIGDAERRVPVALYWDAESRRLGIGLTEASDPDARRLLVTRQGRSISAKDVVDLTGVDLSTAQRWPVELDDEEDLLVADLAQPGEEVTSNRASSASTRPGSAPTLPLRAGAMRRRSSRTMDRPDASPL